MENIIIIVFTNRDKLNQNHASFLNEINLHLESSIFSENEYPLLWLSYNADNQLDIQEPRLNELQVTSEGILLVNDLAKGYKKEVFSELIARENTSVYIWFHQQSEAKYVTLFTEIDEINKERSSHYEGIYKVLTPFLKKEISLKKIINEYFNTDETKLKQLLLQINKIISSEEEVIVKELEPIYDNINKIQQQFIESQKNEK